MSSSHRASAVPEQAGLPTARWRRSWEEAISAFIEELRIQGYSHYTIRDYRADVAHLATLVRVAPWDLDREHLLRAREQLDLLGVAKLGRRRRLAAYQGFLRFVHSSLHAPPAAPAILSGARDLPWIERITVALVWFAGLRLVEIAALEGRDLRLRKRSLTSRMGGRILPVHPRLADLLGELPRHAPAAAYRPLVPGAHGFAANPRTLQSRFQRCATASGFAGVRPETVRRELSAHLIRKGAAPGLVRALLGRDRGRLVAPRQGRFVDLTCLADRIAELPG